MKGVEPMRARCALKFIPSTPAVLPYLRKNCRDIAKLKEGPLTPEGKKRQKWFEYYGSHNNNASLSCRHFDIP